MIAIHRFHANTSEIRRLNPAQNLHFPIQELVGCTNHMQPDVASIAPDSIHHGTFQWIRTWQVGFYDLCEASQDRYLFFLA